MKAERTHQQETCATRNANGNSSDKKNMLRHKYAYT